MANGEPERAEAKGEAVDEKDAKVGCFLDGTVAVAGKTFGASSDGYKGKSAAPFEHNHEGDADAKNQFTLTDGVSFCLLT